MKKTIVCFFFLLTALCGFAQDKKPIVLPGKGKINVETLNKKIDTKQDISQLSLVELRALRNAFAARQGYLFKSSDLRMLFNTTSWYDSLAWLRVDKEDELGPVKYSKAESAFIDKIKAREELLRKQNFTTNSGIVNLDNLINPYQLDVFPDEMRQHLGKYGFGIVGADDDQIFQIYEKNDYTMFPSFVTTDLYLQLYHLYFDTTLRKVEEGKLVDIISDLSKRMYQKMTELGAQSKDKTFKECAAWNAAYFAVACRLLGGETLPVDPAYKDMVEVEINNCVNAQNSLSEFLDYLEVNFAYSLFRPRGHYTRSERCQLYFRAMMWLQTVPFGTDKPFQLRCASIIAEVLQNDPVARKAYDSVSDLITYLMGAPDNITILQVGETMKKMGLTSAVLMKKDKELQAFAAEIDKIGDMQTRIRPKFEFTSHTKINFMPQRYQPDAEVLQEMYDYKNNPTKRDVPMGLDVMAAMGSSAAERILIDELKQPAQWSEFMPNLENMKKQMKATDWNACVANKWIAALHALNIFTDPKLPYFMKTPQWKKKDLNATLASWAELKHDAILYAKQPMVAECGDGSLPAPVVMGYVAPNVGFWSKAVALLDETHAVLVKYGVSTKEIDNITESVRDEAKFLLGVSKKELAGQRLTDEEYEQIRYIGATFENLSLELIKEPDQYLMGWYDVQGTDKSIAVVADVFTSNGPNNPEKSILYEAVGPAQHLYVVVEIDGYLYLMRGGVFSYREFKQPVDMPRLTDEEWQEKVKKYPDTGKPSWMKEIMIPLKNQKPADNETVFYGSGC